MKDMYKTKGYITPLDTVLICSPRETLAGALAQTKSTHEAVFVMDEKKKFLGLVTPYHALFERRYPYTAKVEHCLFHPPRITQHTSLSEVAEHMLATRTYTLPVFDDKGAVRGVITAQSILKGVVAVPEFLHQVAHRMPVRPVVMLDQHATVKQVYHKLRDAGQTRMVLVGETGRLVGVITRRDLREAMTKLAPKEGFAMKVHGLFLENAPIEHDRPAMDFATHNIITAEQGEDRTTILRRMIEKNVSSVVVVTSSNHPVGIFSIRSVLQALSTIRHEVHVPVIWHHQLHGLAGELMVDNVTAILERFGKRLHRRAPAHKIDIYLERIKDAAGQTKEYTVTLSVHFWSGVSYLAKAETFISTAKHVGLETAVHRAIKEIYKQLERDHHLIHHHDADLQPQPDFERVSTAA